jgi:hypothetical protein
LQIAGGWCYFVSASPAVVTSTSAPIDRRNALKSVLCEMLGIEFPMLAFSHWRNVVAAVSRAQGFGILGATDFTKLESCRC